MELYVFCMVSLLVLATVVAQGIYCFMYCSYPLPGGADPCPMVAPCRCKKRKPRRRSNSAEVMISMEDVKVQQPQTPSPPMPPHEYKTRGGQTDV